MHQSTDEEENCLQLQFGDIDFTQLQCLNNEEIYYLLNERKKAGVDNSLFESTYEYLSKVVVTRVADQSQMLAEELGE